MRLINDDSLEDSELVGKSGAAVKKVLCISIRRQYIRNTITSMLQRSVNNLSTFTAIILVVVVIIPALHGGG